MQSIATEESELAEEAFDQFGNSILRLAFSYLQNFQDAEDVLQETIIQLIKTKPSFVDSEHMKAWLLTVSANKSKNLLKYNKYRKCQDIDDIDYPAETAEDLAYVWNAVNTLPEKYREVVHLFYAENYSTKQIAEILKKRETTVRSLLCRGREKLKLILKEDYDFEE